MQEYCNNIVLFRNSNRNSIDNRQTCRAKSNKNGSLCSGLVILLCAAVLRVCSPMIQTGSYTTKFETSWLYYVMCAIKEYKCTYEWHLVSNSEIKINIEKLRLVARNVM